MNYTEFDECIATVKRNLKRAITLAPEVSVSTLKKCLEAHEAQSLNELQTRQSCDKCKENENKRCILAACLMAGDYGEFMEVLFKGEL